MMVAFNAPHCAYNCATFHWQVCTRLNPVSNITFHSMQEFEQGWSMLKKKQGSHRAWSKGDARLRSKESQRGPNDGDAWMNALQQRSSQAPLRLTVQLQRQSRLGA
eukprot:1145133-Pelagomonas_calceolata.AAC.4